MGYFGQPLLVMFLGLPGSGKSYFARSLAEKINAVRLNGDSMRSAMFGTHEDIEKAYRTTDRNILNGYVFSGIDYAVEQVLLRGHDVVYDAHHNKRVDRQRLEELAGRLDARPVVVLIRTPYEVAFERGLTRAEAPDQRQWTAERMRESMERHQKFTDQPDTNEFVIEIDGQMPFETQFAIFQQCMQTNSMQQGVSA